MESVFISRFTMNNIAPKLRKCWTHKIAYNIISEMLKQENLFHSQTSTLPKDAPVKFYLSTTFGLSFMISSVAPTRSSTFYSYLITKIGYRNLKGEGVGGSVRIAPSRQLSDDCTHKRNNKRKVGKPIYH